MRAPQIITRGHARMSTFSSQHAYKHAVFVLAMALHSFWEWSYLNKRYSVWAHVSTLSAMRYAEFANVQAFSQACSEHTLELTERCGSVQGAGDFFSGTTQISSWMWQISFALNEAVKMEPIKNMFYAPAASCSGLLRCRDTTDKAQRASSTSTAALATRAATRMASKGTESVFNMPVWALFLKDTAPVSNLSRR